jgi:hypothetical protein
MRDVKRTTKTTLRSASGVVCSKKDLTGPTLLETSDYPTESGVRPGGRQGVCRIQPSLNNLAALAPALVSAQERIGLKRVNDMFKFSLVVAYGFSPHQVRC